MKRAKAKGVPVVVYEPTLDALKRGSRRVLATCCLNTSLLRVTTHVQCDDFPTSSPMTISGLLGGAMVVSSNR